MGKKLLSIGFAAGVLLAGLAFSLGLLVTGPSKAGANEILSGAPVLFNKDGGINGDVLSDAASWYNDHFWGRQELISVNNWLSAKVFGTSGAENVILGKDGWLYYGSTLEDYTGTAPMTGREIFSAARNLALMAEYCQEQGKEFAFVVAPNKNSLYPDAMPDYGVTAQTSNAQRLFARLEDMEVSYIDLFAAFGEEPEILYFCHDSHWNSRGAALGADVINAAFGRESRYFAGDFSRNQPHAGDLYEMLYPAFTDTETDPVYGGELEYTFASSATRPDSITLVTQSGAEGSLLCYRDSFGNFLYPYLADSFGACRFSRSTAYDLTLEADFVLVELVERNLEYLITYLPVMPAPQRQISLPAASGEIEAEMSAVQKPAGTILVQGTLPEEPDTDSPIYVVCQEGVYEAFCEQDGGFGAYLPEDVQIVGVAYKTGGTLRLLAIQTNIKSEE